MLRIRGFNADPDPDPTFYLNADPDPGSQPMMIHADPDSDPGQTLLSQKLDFDRINILDVGKMS